MRPSSPRWLPRLGILVACLLLVAVAAVGPPPGGTGGEGHFWRMVLYASVALFFSFLCSVAEAVLLSVSPSFLAHLGETESRTSRMLGNVKSDIDTSLAAILTLNTIAHTVGAGGAGAEAAAYYGDRYVGLSMAVLTLLILFLSEIVPKTLGAVYWRSLAAPTAWFIRGLTLLLYPLLWISEKLTRFITRGKNVHVLSREEIAAMAQIGEDHGQLDAHESRILRNLFRFPQLRVRDIMTPRTVVFALPERMTAGEVVKKQSDMPFSRIPVYGESRDDVTGFVLKTDLLLAELQGRGGERLADLARPIRVVDQNASLEHAADELLDKRVHLMAVVDEYGGLAGVVTLEDVVETLIGIEIVDEADKIDDMRILARRKWQERMQHLGIDLAALEGEPSSDEDA